MHVEELGSYYGLSSFMVHGFNGRVNGDDIGWQRPYDSMLNLDMGHAGSFDLKSESIDIPSFVRNCEASRLFRPECLVDPLLDKPVQTDTLNGSRPNTLQDTAALSLDFALEYPVFEQSSLGPPIA